MINWKRHGSIAVITIDNPPVNACSYQVRSGLLLALKEIEADLDIKGVVLIGAGKTFISGSDISEFGRPLIDPQLPDVIGYVENFPVPVVAAIHGAALGGGFELALGCDLRIAEKNAVVGLPEVGLGLVPGAGGTQRLPRLTGVPSALELIISARRVKAPEALLLGMIDIISEGDLLEDSIAALQSLSGKRRVSDMPVPQFDGVDAEKIRHKVVLRAKDRPAAKQAAALILAADEAPFHEMLAHERAVFQEIRISPEAFAARHIFFAERNAARSVSSKVAKHKIDNIAVIGGGTMGAGIAHACLCAGFSVTLIERDEDALIAGKQRLILLREEDVKRKRLLPEQIGSLVDKLRLSTDLSDSASAQLIIEAVPEEMEIKLDLLKRLGKIVAEDTLVATNTSYLDIDALGTALPVPERFLGLHFFAPANVMKLLEIVRGSRTDEATIEAALSVTKRLGKQAVIAENSYGFIGNRIYAAYRRHAEFLIQDGAMPQDVDQAMTDFGMAMGPFAVADLSGLDIAWKMRKAQAAKRDPLQRYVDIPDRLCQAGRLGRKTGAGYYDYSSGKAEIDPKTQEYIAASSQSVGIDPVKITGDEIRARCLGAMVNEAALLMAEGVCRRASDIDVVLVHGYGFPRWIGGPIWWASNLSESSRKTMLKQVAEAEGAGFRAGDVNVLFKSLS
ncbi:3-hydroxyacyl-CoA dehydrogenase NAD-binding domain-containing protein [Brucellaceae bacterium C25G]